MATTSLWSIKNKLNVSLNYITNIEKTLNKNFDKELTEDANYYFNLHHDKDLNLNGEKREFVTAINCGERTTYYEMNMTKKHWGKTDGILAFHGYQSFVQNEVSATTAHEIGVRLANEMWGEKYEIVVATHQNTNHIHNHIILNSISFLDGKKYNNSKTNIAKIRSLSDSLCEEYGISTLKEDTKYTERLNKLTESDEYFKQAKEDIDEIISSSVIFDQVLKKLEKLDYKYYVRNNNLTIYKQGKTKIRLQRLFGYNYSVNNIKERLYYSKQKPFNPNLIRQYLIKPTSLYGLYLHYCKLLKNFSTEQPRQYLTPAMRKELRLLDQFTEETKFLVENKINTQEEFKNCYDKTIDRLYELKNKRENLWRKYHRRKISEDKKEIYFEIETITKEVDELYTTKRICERINDRASTMKTNLNELAKQNTKEINRNR